MRKLLLIALLGWAAPSRSEEPFLLEVDKDEALSWVLSGPNLDADVRDFEGFLLLNMERRGVPTSRLSADSRKRLRLILARTSEEAATELHFFSRSASRFSEEQITAVFAALLDDQDAFPEFLRARVKISRKKEPPGQEPSAETAASQSRMRDYERMRAFLTVPAAPEFNITEGEGGCSHETLFDGKKGVGCSQAAASAVSAGAPFQAVGAAPSDP